MDFRHLYIEQSQGLALVASKEGNFYVSKRDFALIRRSIGLRVSLSLSDQAKGPGNLTWGLASQCYIVMQ